MSVPLGVLTIWLTLSAIIFLLPIALGILKVRSAPAGHRVGKRVEPPSPLEILVPLKGVFPGQETVLSSLLNQTHPSYQVIFIVESESDPANALVDGLCTKNANARKVVGGLSTTCSQKNHNLIAGIGSLNPETRIILFCDSSNMAPPDWLMRFTEPLETSDVEVVTTFRSFDPEPETVGGVSQAIYASFVLLLIVLQPKPWGGATAIRRETFGRLNVTEAWSCTVVDDLVLGNILENEGTTVFMDPENLLRSPLPNQSVKGFLNYLDRQILFPKFTNPGIWFLTLASHLNECVCILVAAVIGLALFPAGLVGAAAGGISCVFLGSTILAALMLRAQNPVTISLRSWLISFYPCIFLAALVFLRSVFRNHISWHGRKYWTGHDGVVLNGGFQADEPTVRS